MSQNVLTTTSLIGLVRVRAGWDNPLQELFCNVQALEAAQPNNISLGCFYKSSYRDIEAMIESLREAAVFLPQEMVDAISRDRENGVENVIRVFNTDGSVQP